MVLWESTFRMESQCQPSNKGDWPRDIYVCTMFFSLADDYSGVFLNFDYNDSNLLVKFTVTDLLRFEILPEICRFNKRMTNGMCWKLCYLKSLLIPPCILHHGGFRLKLEDHP